MNCHLDSDGYPTEEALEKIAKWPIGDWVALMEFVRDLWLYADCGYWQQNGTLYEIATGGWSGNEDLIGALRGNHVFWVMYWVSSHRGGKHVFNLA